MAKPRKIFEYGEYNAMREKCENDREGLELRCHGGYLWELTYSEMGPPGQRANTGRRCPKCSPVAAGLEYCDVCGGYVPKSCSAGSVVCEFDDGDDLEEFLTEKLAEGIVASEFGGSPAEGVEPLGLVKGADLGSGDGGSGSSSSPVDNSSSSSSWDSGSSSSSFD